MAFYEVPAVAKMMAACALKGHPNAFDAKGGCCSVFETVQDNVPLKRKPKAPPFISNPIISNATEIIFHRKKTVYCFLNTEKGHYLLQTELMFPKNKGWMAVACYIRKATGERADELPYSEILFQDGQVLYWDPNLPLRNPTLYFIEDSVTRLFHMLATSCLPFHVTAGLFHDIHVKGGLSLPDTDMYQFTIKMLKENPIKEMREKVADEFLRQELYEFHEDKRSAETAEQVKKKMDFFKKVALMGRPAITVWNTDEAEQKLANVFLTDHTPEQDN